jgi:hypothetical protein
LQGHEGARPLHVHALGARLGAPVLFLGVEHAAAVELCLAQAPNADGARTRAVTPAPTTRTLCVVLLVAVDVVDGVLVEVGIAEPGQRGVECELPYGA